MATVKILIVEDEVPIAEDLADILTIHGYEVVGIAHSYDRALDLLHKHSPDLALLDIALKGNGSGLDVAHHINEKYEIPFIFITSFTDDKTLESVLTTEPSGYIVKPFKEREINPTIKIALAMNEKNQEETFPTLEYINNNIEKGLSDQEYKILICLWQGMKKQEIADKFFVSINTIKTHMTRVYKKLDVNSQVSLIKKLLEL